MTMFTYDLSPLLAAALITVIVWFVRDQSRKKNDERVRQLDEAAQLLDRHAEALERFLSASAPPRELKALLINFSDAMADKGVVEKVAAWAASRPFKAPVESQEADELCGLLAKLHTTRPDLSEDFAMAIVTASMGASLRWPKSAALFDQMFPRLATTPKRDVVIAVTATGFRSGVPFSLRPSVDAMA